MKNRKSILVALTIVVLVILTLLSRHPFEMGILFGSTCLLWWQAGGIVFQKSYKNIAAILVLWLLGLLAYSFICPVWVLYPFLLLVNLTVFLFAPVTNAVTVEEKFWKQAKENVEAKVTLSAKMDSTLSAVNLSEPKTTEMEAIALKATALEKANLDMVSERTEFIRLTKELKESQETRMQRKNRSVFLTGLLSFFAVVTHGMPVSSLLLVALFAEMASLFGAILASIREEPWKL